MIVSAIGRPSCDRSCEVSMYGIWDAKLDATSYLDIISLVIVTTFSEQSMCHDVMNIQLVQYGIRILGNFGETIIETIEDGKGKPCSDLL